MSKSLKRYDIPGHAHELTFSCYHRYEYLNDQMACSIFLNELFGAKERFKFKIWAYVLMPSHVHLLIYPEMHDYKIADILKDIKGKTSIKYRAYIISQRPYKYDIFCVTLSGKKIFRFWQRGSGYDRNLWSANAVSFCQ
jgi:putative transposase